MRFVEVLKRLGPSENVAVVDEKGELTYGELWTQVEQLSAEITANSCLIIRMPRCRELVASLLACWNAQAVPLLMCHTTPSGRFREVVELVRPSSTLTLEGRHDYKSHSYYSGLEYLVCTSGSTGRPRIVKIGEGSLSKVIRYQVECFEVTTESRVFWMLSPGFDASLSDIGVALQAQATLVCADEGCATKLPRLLKRSGATHLDIPPVLLDVYQPGDFPQTVHNIVVGGEPSEPATLRRWAAKHRVVAVYGPTEATICSSTSVVDNDWTKPFVGVPLSGLRLKYRVRDGELLIGGEQVAKGYIPDEGDSFFTEDDLDWFCTGDLVEEAGSKHGLVFKGRQDRQVQLRGQRLELEEVEFRAGELLGHRRVAAVLSSGELCLYWVSGDCPELELAMLKHGLSNSLLPSTMPTRWRAVDRLPRTASQKIDRHQLSDTGFEWSEQDSLSCVQRSLDRERSDTGQTLPVEAIHRLALECAPQSWRAYYSLGRIRQSVLLLGGTGRLGKLIKPMLEEQFDLVTLSRKGEPKGDLEQPWLGLQPSEWSHLKRRVDVVVNLAAIVNQGMTLTQLRKVNSDAMLTLCKLGKPVHQASTLAVCLSGIPASLNDIPTGLIGGYSQSKYLAEHYLQKAGCPGYTIRYGQLLGTPNSHDLLAQVCNGLRSLGAYPRCSRGDLLFDFTSLDWAAKRTMELLCDGSPAERLIADVYQNQAVHYEDLIQVLNTPKELTPLAPEKFFQLPVSSMEEHVCQKALWKCGRDSAEGSSGLDLFLLGNAVKERNVHPETLSCLAAYANLEEPDLHSAKAEI